MTGSWRLLWEGLCCVPEYICSFTSQLQATSVCFCPEQYVCSSDMLEVV